MLTAVLHGLHAQRKRFVLIMTDVKGAFNHTPTAYMDQRYEGLGIFHQPQSADDLEERLRDFLQSIDQDSTFRVRVRHGFTKAASKGWVGLHQGETLSPSKYSWSVDPLLVYLESLAEVEGLGIDLGSIVIDGEEVFFEGSYTVHTAKGDVTFFHQGGRLVAIMFADDLALIAENVTDAQVLLDATNEFYTAASATLCTPKSLYTASDGIEAWSVRLSDFDEIHMEAIVMECRSWRSERRKALDMPARSHEDIETKDCAIILTNTSCGTVVLQRSLVLSSGPKRQKRTRVGLLCCCFGVPRPNRRHIFGFVLVRTLVQLGNCSVAKANFLSAFWK